MTPAESEEGAWFLTVACFLAVGWGERACSEPRQGRVVGVLNVGDKRRKSGLRGWGLYRVSPRTFRRSGWQWG